MNRKSRIKILENPVKNYAWGSIDDIPNLTGISNPKKLPVAEMWLGANAVSSSNVIEDGKRIPLIQIIKENPQSILGVNTAKKFNNRLPFLFKLLAAKEPLSIQAHPNMEQAKIGFEKENSKNIPLNAFERNYKDDNHKPEIICALTPLWALCGFRKIETIISLFEKVHLKEIEKEVIELKENPTKQGLRKFYSDIINMPQPRKNETIKELLIFSHNVNDDPIFNWCIKLGEKYPNDIGVLSPLLLNLVKLNPGQATFLEAGELHAYLDGFGVELMANSDNVLRGGLTAKHINIPELLKILTFNNSDTVILESQKKSPTKHTYPTPTDEFMLSKLDVNDKNIHNKKNNRSIQICICTKGSAKIEENGNYVELKKGTSIMIPANVPEYTITGNAVIYKASVPFEQ